MATDNAPSHIPEDVSSAPQIPSNDIEAFKKALSSSKNIICIAGAGLSAPSGIPIFRGSEGALWRKYDMFKLSTKAGFLDSPSRVWQFEHYRRELVFKAKPNAAHVALAKFTIPLFREQVSPGSTFTLITQNVDELSRKALESVKSSLPAETIGDSLSDPEHPPLIEMHGSLFDLECTAYECKHRETNYNSPLCPALAGTELIYEVGSKEREPDIPKEDLPRCSKCGSLQRPGMVWFGEVPYRVEEVMKLTEKADLILVVGTSSVVHPAAKLAGIVKAAGGKVAVFNIDRSKRDEQADFLFLGSADVILPEALSMKDG